MHRLESNDTADVMCYSMGLCIVDPGYHYCHIWPEPKGGVENAVQQSRARTNLKSVILYFFICFFNNKYITLVF